MKQPIADTCILPPNPNLKGPSYYSVQQALSKRSILFVSALPHKGLFAFFFVTFSVPCLLSNVRQEPFHHSSLPPGQHTYIIICTPYSRIPCSVLRTIHFYYGVITFLHTCRFHTHAHMGNRGSKTRTEKKERKE